MPLTPIPFTSDPMALLGIEVKLFLGLLFDWKTLCLLSTIWPLRLAHSEDELALTRQNVWALAVHGVLIVLQTIFLLFALISPFLGVPAIVYLAVLVLGIQLNRGICNVMLNNYGQRIYYQGGIYARDEDDDALRLVPEKADLQGERWIFINGVSVGSHWLNENLKMISRIFQRPIQGIHNKTYGILFDLIECTVQRTFGYPTLDIRLAYESISAMLAQPGVSKVVLIAHSQGGIESSLVLDWLFATVAPEQVAKLEVYTFGNAANHFNSPSLESGGRLIQHIEHYANTGELVARSGVLFFRGVGARISSANGRFSTTRHWTPWRSNSAAEVTTVAMLRERFIGKVFLRQATGHMLNQHYLRNMFEAADNEFMKSPASVSNFEGDSNGMELGEANGELLRKKSRLWLYRNGGKPAS